MDLGAYTFLRLPKNMTPIEDRKINAVIDTYDDVAYFSWPITKIGLRLELIWNYMSQTEYATILALHAADEQVIFDPEDYLGSGDGTYNVQILSFTGSYQPAFPANRLAVKLELLIMSEV